MCTWVHCACTPLCLLVGSTSIEDRPFGYRADPRCAVPSGVLMTISLTLDLRSPSSLVRNRSEVAFSIQEHEIGHRMLAVPLFLSHSLGPMLVTKLSPWV